MSTKRKPIFDKEDNLDDEHEIEDNENHKNRDDHSDGESKETPTRKRRKKNTSNEVTPISTDKFIVAFQTRNDLAQHPDVIPQSTTREEQLNSSIENNKRLSDEKNGKTFTFADYQMANELPKSLHHYFMRFTMLHTKRHLLAPTSTNEKKASQEHYRLPCIINGVLKSLAVELEHDWPTSNTKVQTLHVMQNTATGEYAYVINYKFVSRKLNNFPSVATNYILPVLIDTTTGDITEFKTFSKRPNSKITSGSWPNVKIGPLSDQMLDMIFNHLKKRHKPTMHADTYQPSIEKESSGSYALASTMKIFKGEFEFAIPEEEQKKNNDGKCSLSKTIDLKNPQCWLINKIDWGFAIDTIIAKLWGRDFKLIKHRKQRTQTKSGKSSKSLPLPTDASNVPNDVTIDVPKRRGRPPRNATLLTQTTSKQDIQNKTVAKKWEDDSDMTLDSSPQTPTLTPIVLQHSKTLIVEPTQEDIHHNSKNVSHDINKKDTSNNQQISTHYNSRYLNSHKISMSQFDQSYINCQYPECIQHRMSVWMSLMPVHIIDTALDADFISQTNLPSLQSIFETSSFAV